MEVVRELYRHFGFELPPETVTAMGEHAKTHRKDRHGSHSKGPATVINKPPSCPSFLTPSAKKEWRRVIKALQPYNILTDLHRACISQYCLLWAQMVDAPDSFNGALHAQLRLLQVELGFTPSAMAKLAAMQQADAEEDPEGWNDL